MELLRGCALHGTFNLCTVCEVQLNDRLCQSWNISRTYGHDSSACLWLGFSL